MKSQPYLPEGRLLSLDFFRGATMFFLIGDFIALASYLVDPSLKGTIIYSIGTQLYHAAWHGLHFWDPIQPFFMFIVGVAIPLFRSQAGETRLVFPGTTETCFRTLFPVVDSGLGT